MVIINVINVQMDIHITTNVNVIKIDIFIVINYNNVYFVNKIVLLIK